MSNDKKNSKHENYRYQVILDSERDAWNWYSSCNIVSQGVDWKTRVPSKVANNINGKTAEQAYGFLIPFLESKYVQDKVQIEKYKKYINETLKEKFADACKKLVDLTGKPIYRNDFTFFLTTFPCGPYNYKKGYMWQYIGWKDVIVGFMHEALHCQFHEYWESQNPEFLNLKPGYCEFLKESLTVIIDEELLPLIEFADRGYDIHKDFRYELHKFWKTNKNFDKLIAYGLKRLPEFADHVINADIVD